MAPRARRSVTAGLVWALFLCLSASARAQTPQETPSLDDLKAPPSPAMSVLGLSPTTVDRPQGIRPLVASIVAASKDNGFPRNYSVEVAPYWMGTPGLSFREYYRSTPRNLYRQLAVSVAMTPLGDAVSSGTSIGFGVRTLALPGRPHPQLDAWEKQLLGIQAARSRLIRADARRPKLIELLEGSRAASNGALVGLLSTPAVDAIVNDYQPLKNERIKLEIRMGDLAEEDAADAADRALSAAERQQRKAQRDKQRADLEAQLDANAQKRSDLATRLMIVIRDSPAASQMATTAALETLTTRLVDAQTADLASLDGQMREAALKIQDLDHQRIGPMLAIATAMAWQIPQNDTRQLSLAGVNFWLSPGYRFLVCPAADTDSPCSAGVEVLGVVRYRNDRRFTPSDQAWEFGGRIVWQPLRPLAVSAEWVGRAGADEDPGSRIVGVAEFQFNKTTYLYASFGRDFAEQGLRRNLVSAIGLNFGFGKQPITTPPVPR